ncbi:MAG TPA: gamma carbonic anhydrase family protein [Kofleriaceae bacterium]|jgi:carbonic anhydrase/acetyltransferase-like protein (isoleucine patch superfamily)
MTAIVRGYRGRRPQIARDAFLAESCAVIGDVEIGAESSIWYGTVVRGDVMPIRIGARTSIQDNSVIHVTSEFAGTIVGSGCTVGHGVILHACTIEDDCLIGMGAIVLDGARVGRGSFVGAGALVTPGTDIPPGSFVLGAPARVKRAVGDKEREQIDYGARHYVELVRAYLAGEG